MSETEPKPRHPGPVSQMTLPPGIAGSWCGFAVAAISRKPWWAKLELLDADGTVVRETFLGPIKRVAKQDWRETLLHVPAAAASVLLALYGDGAEIRQARLIPLDKVAAALRLVWQGRWLILKNWRGEKLGRFGRTRAALTQAPMRAGEPPPYHVWIEHFDHWTESDRQALTTAGVGADWQIAVLPGPPGGEAATAGALSQAWLPPGHGVAWLHDAADWTQLSAPWVAILQAGEVPAAHALACLATAALAAPSTGWMCADTDQMDAAGERRNPCLKPRPDKVLLRSGLLTQGLCGFRRDALPAEIWPSLALAAGAAKQALAAANLAAGLNIPAILTHIPSVDPAPKAVQPPKQTSAEPPLVSILPLISILIVSACRSPHVLPCLRRLLAGTDYPRLEICVAVSQIDPADRRQAGILRQLRKNPSIRVLDLQLPEFNYATANNRAAAAATGRFLILLNDDVVPQQSDWLTRMLAYMEDPAVAAVGARLHYGNGAVQHAGVILGLGNLCDHAARFSDADKTARWHLPREVSAVTGACMLVRAQTYAELGGLDEAFAIALNDVDFCLRLSARGARIIYAADAALYHYESLSLGRHYGGSRAGLSAVEIGQLRARWSQEIADDPWYNPQASLQAGFCWQVGFGREASQKPWQERITPT